MEVEELLVGGLRSPSRPRLLTLTRGISIVASFGFVISPESSFWNCWKPSREKRLLFTVKCDMVGKFFGAKEAECGLCLRDSFGEVGLCLSDSFNAVQTESMAT